MYREISEFTTTGRAAVPVIGTVVFRIRAFWLADSAADGRWVSRPLRSREGRTRKRWRGSLGAWHYIDSQAGDPAAELRKLGGAKVILATVTNGEAMSAVLGGLAVKGTLMVVGAAESLQVQPLPLLLACQRVQGWYSGTSIDSQDTLSFSVLSGVRSMNEVFPLDRVNEAYERMLSGKARFRVVLTTGN